MKKRILALLLALSMLLASAGVLAEEAAYVPGVIARQLLADAWNAGKLVTLDLGINMDLNLDALGLTGEDAAAVATVLSLLQNATVSIGAGKTDNGVRLELSGKLAGAADEAVSITAAVDLTAAGASLESDLIPGQRITATWETLLALCGASEEDIAQLLALRDMDLPAMLEQLNAQLPEILASAEATLSPYIETLFTFLDTLAYEEFTDVHKKESYPRAATLSRVTFTPKDFAPLFVSLADQLEQDTTLAPLLDSVLAELAADPATTAELCADMREFAAAITSDMTFVLDLGMNEDGELLYAEFYDSPVTGHIRLFSYPMDEPNTYTFLLSFASYPDGANVTDAFYVGAIYTLDPADPYACDLHLEMDVTASGESVVSASADTTRKAIVTDESLPGYSFDMTMTESISSEGETTRALMSSQAVWAQTVDAGEAFALQETLDYVFPGDMNVSLELFSEGMFTPDTDGANGSMRYGIQCPALGLNSFVMNLGIRSETHTPAALTELALETATTEQMTDVENTVTGTLNTKLVELISVLPADALATFMTIGE